LAALKNFAGISQQWLPADSEFHSFGPICSSVQVCRTKITNLSCGYGFVTFKYCQDAEKALKCLNFRTLLGQPMHIMWLAHITSNRSNYCYTIFSND
uniref:RRM domain-containing protein n=1 Tax=Sinocyclocheilus anshuiensis TaxID=1608454 RepID=A0A671NS87_9TELE